MCPLPTLPLRPALPSSSASGKPTLQQPARELRSGEEVPPSWRASAPGGRVDRHGQDGRRALLFAAQDSFVAGALGSAASWGSQHYSLHPFWWVLGRPYGSALDTGIGQDGHPIGEMGSYLKLCGAGNQVHPQRPAGVAAANSEEEHKAIWVGPLLGPRGLWTTEPCASHSPSPPGSASTKETVKTRQYLGGCWGAGDALWAMEVAGAPTEARKRPWGCW